jgi:hypothetical protein
MPDLIVTVTFKERETPHTQDTQLKCALKTCLPLPQNTMLYNRFHQGV